MPTSTVDDLELAYWKTYLGKSGSLNSLRYEGYGQLAGMTTGSVSDRERAYLITMLGLSAAVGAATSLDDLRRQHRIQILTNEAVTDTAVDLDYKFWQVGFSQPIQSVVMSTNPVAYWRFEENSGTSYADIAGGHTANKQGTGPAQGSGAGLTKDSSFSANFDNVAGNYYRVPYNATPWLPTTFTATAVIYPTVIGGGNKTIFATNDGGSNNMWAFRIETDGQLNFMTGGPSWTNTLSGVGNLIPINTKTVVSVAADSANKYIWINGVKVVSLAVAVPQGAITQDSAIGAITFSGGAEQFGGRIDELFINNSVLADATIQNLHAKLALN